MRFPKKTAEVYYKQNPNRGKPEVADEAYQPEYERLGIQPDEVVFPPDRAAFIKANHRRAPLVQSGQDEDFVWTQGLADKEVNLPPEMEQKRMQIVSTKSVQQKPVQKQAVKQPPKQVQRVPEPEPEEEEEEASISSLAVGDYVLIYGGNVVATGALDEIKSVITDLVDSAEDQIDSDDFIVLKRMSVKLGIFVE